ncbi:putative N-glycosylase/DNA lyase [bacterium HR19]|nr:putative N-glycosylase/DNA lyase [bacterium HR19]
MVRITKNIPREVIREIEDIINVSIDGTPLHKIVEKRVLEFKELGISGHTKFDFRPFLDIELETGLFGELCFCFLTANSSAELGIRIQKQIGDEGFFKLEEKEIADILKKMGHRYPEIRARYIVLARQFDIGKVLKEKSGKRAREIVINLKGLGMKESSHFLRNIGYDDIAIVDRHIYRFLVRHNLVPEKNSISPSLYLLCEKTLENISAELGIPLSALDLFIFFKQAGKVLK